MVEMRVDSIYLQIGQSDDIVGDALQPVRERGGVGRVDDAGRHVRPRAADLRTRKQ